MSTSRNLLALVERIDALMTLPRVHRVWLPEPAIATDKDAEFGVVELDDGAVGLFYAWMGESQAGMSSRYDVDEFAGSPAVSLARYFAGDDDIARSIGLATINAITQCLFTAANYEPPDATDSMAGLSFADGDHLGMIGNFPSLVRRAESRGIPVTVIERKRHMLRDGDGVTITLDPSRLRGCNKIICTAATLINNSIDDMLPYCRDAAEIAMIGPSASFPPEPLFDRGVTIVGGSRVTSATAVIESQRAGRGLRGCSRRYLIHRDDWPGTAALLERVAT